MTTQVTMQAPELPWMEPYLQDPASRGQAVANVPYQQSPNQFVGADPMQQQAWAATANRAIMVFFAALAFLAVWWLLYRQRIRYAALWALGLLLVSEAFLYRMSIPRAQSLSLAVLALGLHWLLHRQYRWLIPLAFVYVWLYDAFPLLLALSGLYTIALWLVERRFDYRPLVYSGVGIMLGLLVNPYFPVNLVFIARHLLPELLDSTALWVGSEWYPYTTGQLLSNSLPALLV